MFMAWIKISSSRDKHGDVWRNTISKKDILVIRVSFGDRKSPWNVKLAYPGHSKRLYKNKSRAKCNNYAKSWMRKHPKG